MTQYQTRRANLVTWMAQNSIGLVIIIDSEEKRDPALRYFSGHPSDGVLGIAVDGTSILCPWDEILAKEYASVDIVIPFTQFDRSPITAAAGIAKALKIAPNTRIEIPSSTPYPQFLRYVDALNKYDVVCRDNGTHKHIKTLRAIKDEAEIEIIKTASEITDKVIDQIEENVRNGNIKTETDVALFIEKASRKAGCEGTGFDTLAAGPARSANIHCFPNYTNNEFPGTGLSILDFGLCYKGYTSDVTLTIAKGPLSQNQEKLLKLVEKAYETSLQYYRPGTSACIPCQKADEIFASAKKSMPHALGHGIGLEVHEAPYVRGTGSNTDPLEAGMVVTIEPGLYDSKEGGCRLENDVLITTEGCEVLTHSRIIRLDLDK